MKLAPFVAVFGFYICPATLAQTTPPPPSPSLWTALHAPDLATFAANLRRAGFPEPMVGLLVSHEVNDRFREREARLRPSVASLESLRQEWTVERRSAVLELKREKNDLLRAVLGTVPDTTAAELSPLLNALLPAQREPVRLILEDYNELNARLFTASRGVILREDREKLLYLETARDSDLTNALGADAAVDLQIALSRHMQDSLAVLTLFQPTQQELRDIFTVRRKLRYEIEQLNISNPLAMADVRKAVNAELKKMWAPQRFAYYLRTASIVYQPIYRLTQRFGLPSSVADRIYESQATLAARADKLGREAAKASKAPLTATLPDITKGLIAEHCAMAKELLGETGFQEYYLLCQSIIDAMRKGQIVWVQENPG